MTEMQAAIACAQLSKGPQIVEGRRELAHELTDMVKDFPQIKPPQELSGCKHVYYIWAAKIWTWQREDFVKRIFNLGIPMREGYSPPLHRVFNTPDSHPVAENLEDKELMTFDVCSYSPTGRQRRVMRKIFQAVGDSLK